MGRTTSPTSIRLSGEAEQLRTDLAAHFGVNKTAVVEMAIRELARRNGLPTIPAIHGKK